MSFDILLAMRVDCYQLNVEKPLHIFKELTPDCTTCIIDKLSEKTTYRISVTAITEEYFNSHKIKELKQLPKLILETMPWLPSTRIDAMTSGTEPASHLEWKMRTHNKSLVVSWRPPLVYGTNKLVNQVFCSQEIAMTPARNANPIAVVKTPLPAKASSHKMSTPHVGARYRVWVEAVVLIKLNIEADTVRHGYV